MVKKSKLMIVSTSHKAGELSLVLGEEWDVFSSYNSLVGKVYDLILVADSANVKIVNPEEHMKMMQILRTRLRLNGNLIEIY